MDIIAKALAAIGTFFMGFLQPYTLPLARPSTPVDGGISFPTLPSATPTYQTGNYVNPTLNYQFKYPSNTVVKTNDETAIIEKVTFMLRSDNFTQSLTPDYLLKHDHWCDADGPMGPGIHCTNTAIRPFTNTVGTQGYLVKRDKDIGEKEPLHDWVYIFPRPNTPDDGVTLYVDDPTPSHLEVLDTIASSFSWK